MRLVIENFRSIRHADVELAPLTVLYGQNGAGKSNLVYALIILRNVILNPALAVDSFLRVGSMSLGGFESIVHNHKKVEELTIAVEAATSHVRARYGVVLGDGYGYLTFAAAMPDSDEIKLNIHTTFPYRVDQLVSTDSEWKSPHAQSVSFDGINVKYQRKPEPKYKLRMFLTSLNLPTQLVSGTLVIPVQRGFTKPIHSVVSVTPQVSTEDEVASVLADDKHLQVRVSSFLERITGRELRVHSTPGTFLLSVDCTDRSTGIQTEIVNEGHGINQLAYMLTLCLYDKATWVCIEEPELNLHPTAIRSLARTLVDIYRKEGKKFVVTTHSESFVLALLTMIAEGSCKPEEVGMYFVEKTEGATEFSLQSINERGQIEGGLSSFMEGELQDVKTFLGLK